MSNVTIMGLQKVTLLDFPGKVACTVFLGGCNLRCPFCHNASLVLPRDTKPVISEEEFFAFLRKRQGILDGVCVTGGEPLLQPGVVDFIAKIRFLGYAVKLDTNGTRPDRLAPLLEAKAVDFVAMDVKSSPLGYEAATGVTIDFDKIRESIRLIRESGIAHEFRTTVVAGLHTKDDIVEAAKLVGDSPYFLQSFADSGDLIDSNRGFNAFSPAEMHEICNEARAFAPNCAVRGIE